MSSNFEFQSKSLFVVLGMHRSGTSAVARGLLTLGVDLGEQLEPAAEGVNAKGYWEDMDVVRLNEEMLEACGLFWHSFRPVTECDVDKLCSQGFLLKAVSLLESKLQSGRNFGFKDPRTAKLMPFWRRVFAAGAFDVKYILAYRNPLSVADSLAKRDGFTRGKTLLLAAEYLSSCLQLLLDEQAVVVDYDQLMQQPMQQLEKLADKLNLQVLPEAAEVYCQEFLDQDLRHSKYDCSDIQQEPAAIALVKEIHTFLTGFNAEQNISREHIQGWQDELERWASVLVLLDEQESTVTHGRQLRAELAEENIKITQMVHERDARIIKELDRVSDLEKKSETLKQKNEVLNEQLQQHEQSLVELQSDLQLKQQDLDRLVAFRSEILASTSWRVTVPLRFASRAWRFTRRLLQVTPEAVRTKGGVKPFLVSGYRLWRSAGLLGIRAGLVSLERQQKVDCLKDVEAVVKPAFAVTPLYLAPEVSQQEYDVASLPKQRVAVHLHVFYLDLLDDFLARFKLIPLEFDLFVSTSQALCVKQVQEKIEAAQLKIGQLVVEQVENRGRDIAPLIVQFGQRLSGYDVVGHFHTKKSPHNQNLSNWFTQILDALLGQPGDSPARIGYFFEQLAAGVKFVYPQGCLGFIKQSSGWDDNYATSKHLLEKYTNINIDAYPKVKFPEGAMWWARKEAVTQLLSLPLSFEDFEAEPIGTDGTLAHALERLVFVLADDVEGPLLRVEHGDSVPDYRWYESQQDFSDKIIHSDIKVLSYYLPQFHPIAENDEWHGKGFTEWTKVRAANPLFYEHYQQHIPHENIGYYLLDSPQTLIRQAEDMRKAGVHGQVFYHYWFSGKMILEKPAQMLLENKQIEMPFCFCWANENWTRRWDGNENEVLLGQDYSSSDAAEFIKYLIPFFRDERYIRVDDRPVLFVYRPSSIPDAKLYQQVWAEECISAGLKPPYVVAVLTRGASSPDDFGMDAGTERVLHDWTSGNAPEIKQSLHAYRDINGSVLHYDDVADYYSHQQDAKRFTYFRNLVPQWDNTARYGSEAFVIHGSTPKKFQSWFKQLVDYSQQNLPQDRQFILVNAWNEWAEGAHLEPDSRYGYSYLNSIGRVLSGLDMQSRMAISPGVDANIGLHVQLPEHLVVMLNKDPAMAEDYLYGLQRSLQLLPCKVTINAEGQSFLPDFTIGSSGDANYILELRRVSFFAEDVVGKLLEAAQTNPESVVIANSYGPELLEVLDNSCTTQSSLYESPLVLRPTCQQSIKNVFVRTDAMVFARGAGVMTVGKRPAVTTVIRVHAQADLLRLHNALGCLAAMESCNCIPLIAAQGFGREQKQQLEQILQQYKFAQNRAKIIHFPAESDKDLRSKMLNEGLLAVETDYAAFLDYDDFVFNDAYAWLINRLRKTRKAVAFGRVFATTYEKSTARFLHRSKTYEYGGSYEEFKRLNHAPLHSFMLNLKRLDTSKLQYFDNHKYMEDYYMTLQLFTKDNADWEGLRLNRYVGDYIHSVDSTHTLAFVDDEGRSKLLKNSLYLECEERIHQLRQTLN